MKAIVTLIILSLITTRSVLADSLTEKDRITLLKKLEEIREKAEDTQSSQKQAALNAYQNAMGSPDAALELYAKCVRLIDFDKMQKKEADFREWKRANSEKFSEMGFKLALQLQLRWLVLCLKVADEDVEKKILTEDANSFISSMISKVEDLHGYQNILRENAVSSYFARAYDMNNLKLDKWPTSALPISAVYENCIFPSYRKSEKIKELESAWNQRIKNEAFLLDQWSKKPGNLEKSTDRSPEYEEFVSKTRPSLEWESYTDLFKHGNQREAAARMFNHIESNIHHTAAKEWTGKLMELLKPTE